MDNIEEKSTSHLGLDTRNLKLIGQGHEGKVYLVPENRVLKVFYSSACCKSQLKNLITGQPSRFFPTIYDHDDCSILMSFITGNTVSHFLRHNSLSKELSLELVAIIEEFKNLNFTRLDIRLAHIYVQATGEIKIIDPRGSFEIHQPFPLLMLRGLNRHGVLDDFFNFIRQAYPDYYKHWNTKFNK